MATPTPPANGGTIQRFNVAREEVVSMSRNWKLVKWSLACNITGAVLSNLGLLACATNDCLEGE